MKRIFLLFVTFVAYLYATSQTTLEEYNYVTKGYKIQIESGLDDKVGYSWKDAGVWGLTWSDGKHRECEFKILYHDGVECACLMIYKRTDVSNGAQYYICIPRGNNSELWNKTWAFINEHNMENDAPLLQTICWAMMHFTSNRLDLCGIQTKPTTSEEYNYLTKGVKIQLNSGLDMKKGYDFFPWGEWSTSVSGTHERVCEYAILRESPSEVAKGILMHYYYKEGNKEDFVCIPVVNASSDIWDQTLKYVNSIDKNSSAKMRIIIYSLMKAASECLSFKG